MYALVVFAVGAIAGVSARRIVRPIAKVTLKGALVAGRKLREAQAELSEELQDVSFEVADEMSEHQALKEERERQRLQRAQKRQKNESPKS
jgi:hypothetical protein